jgi:hypothetical protein
MRYAFLAAFFPPNASAVVIFIDLEKGWFFFFTFLNHQITSWMELTTHRQIHRVRNLTRDRIEPSSLLLELRDGF